MLGCLVRARACSSCCPTATCVCKWGLSEHLHGKRLVGCTDTMPASVCYTACRVDIGDAPYAPNVYIDARGRVVLWLWLRDPRTPPPAVPPSDTCGCLALPRVLTFAEAHRGKEKVPRALLFQQPLPELSQLRGTMTLDMQDLQTIRQDAISALHTLPGSHFECKLQFSRYAQAACCTWSVEYLAKVLPAVTITWTQQNELVACDIQVRSSCVRTSPAA